LDAKPRGHCLGSGFRMFRTIGRQQYLHKFSPIGGIFSTDRSGWL
jgi:hypothetical protein